MKKKLSFDEINDLASKLVKYIDDNKINILGLIGDLGTGKTHFTKQIANLYDIKDNIKSPTFNYVNTYKDTLAHFDVYRLNDSNELYEIGFDDYLDYQIIIIEWANIVQNILPEDNSIYVELEHDTETTRFVSVYMLKKGVKEYINFFNNDSN